MQLPWVVPPTICLCSTKPFGRTNKVSVKSLKHLGTIMLYVCIFVVMCLNIYIYVCIYIYVHIVLYMYSTYLLISPLRWTRWTPNNLRTDILSPFSWGKASNGCEVQCPKFAQCQLYRLQRFLHMTLGLEKALESLVWAPPIPLAREMIVEGKCGIIKTIVMVFVVGRGDKPT